MNIVKNLENDKLTVAVEGRLDTTTAPELEQALSTSLDGVKDLVLDFASLEYVSSAGLRVLLSTQKAMLAKGSMKLINVNDSIMEVFDITGFADVLTIEK